MASHPRLGRASAAHQMRHDMRLWIKLCSDAAEALRVEMHTKLYDRDWASELYLSHAQVRWQQLKDAQDGCVDMALNPLHHMQRLARSDAFNWLVVLASVVNTIMLMLEHEANSFPGKMWPDFAGWAVFHAGLRGVSIAVSATYALEFGLVVLSEGIGHYFRSLWHFLDLAIAVVCIFLLPVEARELHCFIEAAAAHRDSVPFNVRSCYEAQGSIWSLARSWRLLRFLKLFSTFPELAKQMLAVVASLRPVMGVLWLLALLLLIYIGVGINVFGGLLMLPARKADLALGGSVFATVTFGRRACIHVHTRAHSCRLRAICVYKSRCRGGRRTPSSSS